MKQSLSLSLSQIRLVAIALLMLFITNRTTGQTLRAGMDAVVTMWADTSGNPVAMVKRIGDPIAGAAPFSPGNWTTPPTPVSSWTPANIGQVFGTTIDAIGNVFFGATAMYYPTSFGNPRVTFATLAPAPTGYNGFHAVAGSFGLIYKADGSSLSTTSCIVTASPTNAGAGVGTNKIYNTGYGIGNIAYSSRYNKLYASNLEDGKIYCMDITGNIAYVFDPLGPDDNQNSIAPLGERVFAVGVNNEFDGTTRLYYSVLLSNTSQSVIRSVELTINGNFVTGSDALEITVPPSLANTWVPDIAFSVRGELLVAEKGDPHKANVYQYYGRHNAWSVAQDLPVSDYGSMDNSNGGVDYGFMKSGTKTVCDSLIWTTENAMAGVSWYGIHSIPHNGFAPFVGNNFGSQSYVVDYDGISGASPKGKFGDIVFYDSSCNGTGPTDICGLVSVSVIKDTGAGCCYNVYISNKYNGQYFTALDISTGHLNIDNVSAGSSWGGITYQSGNAVSFGDTSHLWYMPKDSASSSGFLLAKICLSGSGSDILRVRWRGNAPQFDTVCEKNINITGCAIPVDTNCVGVVTQKIVCNKGVLSMQFQIKNNSSFTMRSVTIFNLNPNAKAATTFIPIADLLPGNTSPIITVPLIVKNNATTGCFFFSACDLNVFPGTSGQYPKYCCLDSIRYCADIPQCDSCDAITITATKTDSVKCCYALSLTNNLLGTTITCIRFKGESGTQFALFSGWNIQAPVSSNKITICSPGSGISNGSYPGFANFCITGTSTSPYRITVDFLNKKGDVICSKTLEFTNCELVKPTCANILDDSLYCDGNKTKYSFHIKNNSSFPLYQIDLRLSDTSFKLDKYLIIPDSPIVPGAKGGPYLITVDSSATGNKTFCMYLTGHNNIYIPDSLSATQCCTDSLGVICLPYINCDSSACCTCCEFPNLVIPNGITPNNDGVNDALVIQNAKLCSAIKIIVYNRWGNIVFRDNQYNNNWTGTNKEGQLLPQGTYFVLIELPNGSKKTTYIDIRY